MDQDWSHLGVADLQSLLPERREVRHRKGVEQRDAGDSGHGHDGEVVQHRVLDDTLHEPS